jgi:DNA-binding transcriptional regulator YbjK
MPSLPVLRTSEEAINAFLFECPQVLDMGIAVTGLEEVQILAGLELIAFPAACDALLLTTLPHLAERRAAATPARFLAAELHQRPQNIVALIIMLERFEEGNSRQKLRRFVELGSPQFFSKVSRQVGNLALIAHAIATVQTAIGNQVLVLSH